MVMGIVIVIAIGIGIVIGKDIEIVICIRS